MFHQPKDSSISPVPMGGNMRLDRQEMLTKFTDLCNEAGVQNVAMIIEDEFNDGSARHVLSVKGHYAGNVALESLLKLRGEDASYKKVVLVLDHIPNEQLTGSIKRLGMSYRQWEPRANSP